MEKIIVFMTVRNISQKSELFSSVFEAASRISKKFYITNHGSDDDTLIILDALAKKYNCDIELKNEDFIWTMDDMKSKHYKLIKRAYPDNYLLELDWDEVLSEELIEEILTLDDSYDAYQIRFNNFFIGKILSRFYQPRLFKVGCVEIDTFQSVHDLRRLRTKNVKILKGCINHFSYGSIDELIDKTKLYSKIEANSLFQKNRNIWYLKIVYLIVKESIMNILYSLFWAWNIRCIEWLLYSFWIIPRTISRYMYYLENKRGI